MSKKQMQCSIHFGSIEAIILRATGVLWSTRCPVDWFINLCSGKVVERRTKTKTHVVFGICFFDRSYFNKGTPFFGGGAKKLHVFWLFFLKNDIFQIDVCGISGRFAISFCSLAVGLPKKLAPTDLGGVGGCFGHTSCTFVFINKEM